jgi:hypothetical protein
MSQDPGYGLLYSKPKTGIKRIREVNLGDMATQDASSVVVTGGTVLGATLSGAVQSITEAGAISLNANHVKITGPAESTYAVTLAAPTRGGQTMVIEMISTTSTNSVTLALTNVIGGSAATTATFDAAAETLTLISNSTKWIVLDEIGVTLA